MRNSTAGRAARFVWDVLTGYGIAQFFGLLTMAAGFWVCLVFAASVPV